MIQMNLQEKDFEDLLEVVKFFRDKNEKKADQFTGLYEKVKHHFNQHIQKLIQDEGK